MTNTVYDEETIDRIEELAILAGQKALEAAVHEHEATAEYRDRAEQAIQTLCDFVNGAVGEPLLNASEAA